MTDGPRDPDRARRRPGAAPGTGGPDGPLETRFGVGGAAPARSALTLRAVLAVLGLVVCALGATWAVTAGAPPGVVVVLVVLVVVGRRKARGEPG